MGKHAQGKTTQTSTKCNFLFFDDTTAALAVILEEAQLCKLFMHMNLSHCYGAMEGLGFVGCTNKHIHSELQKQRNELEP